jgi:hypothetical protein
MSLFPYVGPMTTDDIFWAIRMRSNRSLSCRDRMCGGQDCETCRGPQEEDDEQQEESANEEDQAND